MRQWPKEDGPWHMVLSVDGEESERCKVLQKATGSYRVARSLSRSHDVLRGIPRLLPLWDALREVTPMQPSDHGSPVRLIEELNDRISRRYGGRSVLSLASKMGWLRFRSPVIIYDSYARKALGLRAGVSYGAYVEAWRHLFTEVEVALVDAAKPYDTSTWFVERLLDIYLWHVGHTLVKSSRT